MFDYQRADLVHLYGEKALCDVSESDSKIITARITNFFMKKSDLFCDHNECWRFERRSNFDKSIPIFVLNDIVKYLYFVVKGAKLFSGRVFNNAVSYLWVWKTKIREKPYISTST